MCLGCGGRGEGEVAIGHLDRTFGDVSFADDVTFTEEGELGAGLGLLDLIDRDGEGSGHVAIEDDVSCGDAFELAGKAVAVGEDEDIGRRGGWFRGRGGCLGVGERGKGEEGEEEQGEWSVHGKVL